MAQKLKTQGEKKKNLGSHVPQQLLSTAATFAEFLCVPTAAKTSEEKDRAGAACQPSCCDCRKARRRQTQLWDCGEWMEDLALHSVLRALPQPPRSLTRVAYRRVKDTLKSHTWKEGSTTHAQSTLFKKNSSGRSCRLVVNSSSTHYSINVRSGGMAPLAGWKDGDLRVAV